jgi:SAM-dependent methyltransferase
MIKRIFINLVNFNISVSKFLEPSHVADTHAYVFFDYICKIELLNRENKIVLDVGAGQKFHFDEIVQQRDDIYIMGQDISNDEMEKNISLSEKIACDACDDIPVADGALDLILARATIEHLHNVNAFLAIAHQKLKPNGKLIVTFAGKWATFAIINQILPQNIKLFLLKSLVPGSEGQLGFPAHYNNSSFWKFSDAARSAGFLEEVGYASYYGTSYFRFFPPLFIVSYFLDTLRLMVGVKNLSSYNTFVLKKTIKS